MTRRPRRSVTPTRHAVPAVAVAVLLALMSAVLAPGQPAVAAERGARKGAESVVIGLRANGSSECTLASVKARHGLVRQETVLASRGIYRVVSTDPKLSKGAKLAKKLARDTCLTFAEADSTITLADDQFHSWTTDGPTEASASEWQDQPATTTLRLAEAHRVSRGADTLVAVLDTGVDATHPALAGRVRSGYDYVDDDRSPADTTCGCDTDGDGHRDGAVGHGTFVAGTIALVAPEARILPLRVLDADGEGTVFAVATAVLDAVDAGADVINLSFGTDGDTRSKLLDKALDVADDAGVLVVAAAGNGGRGNQHYPANSKSVWAVGAMAADDIGLAPFSNYGKWVDVAAAGEGIVGLMTRQRYVRWSGTSVATPIVSGQLALLRSTAPSVSAAKVRESIEKTARKVDGANGRKVEHGRIDIPASLAKVRTYARR